MATPKSQRIGIWIIAIVMVIGTIGSFAVLILSNQNTAKEQDQLARQQAQQQQQATNLSNTYYPIFKQYQTAPASFDPDSVGNTVATFDFVVGTGATIGNNTKYQAYYIGWNPKGVTFDSSFNGNALKAPFDTAQGDTITGWSQGVQGMKVGGVREITIPSQLAYGSSGAGSNIPPNTPIKFIIMVIAID